MSEFDDDGCGDGCDDCGGCGPGGMGGGGPINPILLLLKMQMMGMARQLVEVANRIHQTDGDPMAGLVAETVHNMVVTIFKTTEQIQNGETKDENLQAFQWHKMVVKWVDDHGGVAKKVMPAADLDALLRAAMDAQMGVEEPKKDEEKPN
jgi:hypothetical protein